MTSCCFWSSTRGLCSFLSTLKTLCKFGLLLSTTTGVGALDLAAGFSFCGYVYAEAAGLGTWDGIVIVVDGFLVVVISGALLLLGKGYFLSFVSSTFFLTTLFSFTSFVSFISFVSLFSYGIQILRSSCFVCFVSLGGGLGFSSAEINLPFEFLLGFQAVSLDVSFCKAFASRFHGLLLLELSSDKEEETLTFASSFGFFAGSFFFC